MSRSFTLISLPYLSLRNESFKVKAYWLDTSMVCPDKYIILLRPFSTWVLTRANLSKTIVHRAPTFVVQYIPPIEMSFIIEFYNLCFVFVEELVTTIDRTWHEHLFHTTISVPLEEADIFRSTSAHSDLVHCSEGVSCVSEGAFCDKAPAPIQKFGLFLPVILCYVRNHWWVSVLLGPTILSSSKVLSL